MDFEINALGQKLDFDKVVFRLAAKLSSKPADLEMVYKVALDETEKCYGKMDEATTKMKKIDIPKELKTKLTELQEATYAIRSNWSVEKKEAGKRGVEIAPGIRVRKQKQKKAKQNSQFHSHRIKKLPSHLQFVPFDPTGETQVQFTIFVFHHGQNE